ncbi:hypothetical protein GF391_00325 [Candidatus Uhrbacteria bacterium]|nr:hypothetical protein [Candidatus Uhrbacteria bacterium]
MKYIYYIIFFAGLAVLAIAGVVWYLRSSDPGGQIYKPFGSSDAPAQETLYDPPSDYTPPGQSEATSTLEPSESELVPPTLPPGLEP